VKVVPEPRFNIPAIADAVRTCEHLLQFCAGDADAIAAHGLLVELQKRAWRHLRYSLEPLEASETARLAVNRAFAGLDPAQRQEALMRLLHALTDDESVGHA
jgi:hypothetical protein